VKVAHPLMLRAIAAAKKKNDRIDAGKIADCLRCDFLPECHMAPTEIRERRRILRYRTLVMRQAVQMKNRISGLLMETGVTTAHPGPRQQMDVRFCTTQEPSADMRSDES
jgi:transposase